MKTLLYIHGFGSSGSSGTVMMLRQMLYPHGVKVLAPDLPVLPADAIALLRELVETENPDLIIGTIVFAIVIRGAVRILKLAR